MRSRRSAPRPPRAFVAAGRGPDDPANVARRPVREDLRRHRRGRRPRRGPRRRRCDRPEPRRPARRARCRSTRPPTLARLARAAAPRRRRPADRRRHRRRRRRDRSRPIVAALDPDAIQLSGDEPPRRSRRPAAPAWKVAPPPGRRADDAAASRASSQRGRAYLAAGATRILLDTAGGPHPGGTGTRARRRAGRRGRPRGAGHARRRPATRPTSPRRCATIPAVGVDVASGVERAARRRASGRARTRSGSRCSSSGPGPPATTARTSPFGPTPVHAGLLEADAAGRWGMERDFGGRYVPETLMAALEQLETPTTRSATTRVFWAELRELLARFAGRPTPLYRADRLADGRRARGGAPARGRGAERRASRASASTSSARTSPTPGAHKINNALGQALLTRRLGKTRVIAETGAGQHGVATATACALLDLPCVVYMGAEDIERQAPERAPDARARRRGPLASRRGTATLKDAVNEAMRDWVTNVETTHYVLGSAMGPHPYPTIVRDLQRRIGDEAAAQLRGGRGPAARTSRSPASAAARTRSGCSPGSSASRRSGSRSPRRPATGSRPAATRRRSLGGTPGILHGSRSLMLQDRDGQVVEAHSRVGRASTTRASARSSPRSPRPAGSRSPPRPTARRSRRCRPSTRTEGILPALETAHAIAALPRLLAGIEGSAAPWPDEVLVLLGFSGRGDKDLAALERFADVEPWRDAGDDRVADRPRRHRTTTAGARRIARGVRARAARRPRRADPVRRRRLPGRRDELRGRARGRRRRRRPARGRAAVLGPARRRRDAPARLAASRSRPARRSSGSLALIERIARGPAGPPARADGLREPGHRRRRRREAVARRLADAGAAGLIVADLTPDEGAPVRGGRPRGRPGRRLPRRPDDAARSAAPRSPRGAAGSCTACRWSA